VWRQEQPQKKNPPLFERTAPPHTSQLTREQGTTPVKSPWLPFRLAENLDNRGRIAASIMSSNPADTMPTVPTPVAAEEPSTTDPGPYYFEGGLRRVRPYHYTYNTYCKERWRDRTLLDIFTSEFRDRETGYYVWLSSAQNSQVQRTAIDPSPAKSARKRQSLREWQIGRP
jgi:hypothetical protein